LSSELEEVVGQKNVSTLAADRLVYSTDWSWIPQMWLDRGMQPPAADFVVHPGSAQEISAILKIANSYRIPVVPWGGGSGTQGGAIPTYGGILLDLKRLNDIIEINEDSLYVTAQAGVNGSQLEWALNEKNLTLPHYPASANCATLGGYLAPRGSGTISTKYGKAEDLVMSMEVVLPDSTIIRTPPVPNHASGPDFMRLFLGSEGTLGVITEVTMQIERLPEVRLLRAMLFKDITTGLEAGRRMMVQRLNPLVIRMYDPSSTGSLVKEVLGYELQGAYMIIGFDGWEEIALAQEKRALAICKELGAQDLGREAGERWWNHRYDFYYPPWGLHLPYLYGTVETISVFDKIEQLYYAKKEALEKTFEDWDLSYIGHFSHWFPWGASLYDRFIVKDPPQDPHEALKLHNRIWAVAVRTSLKNGGMLNEHHGIGLKLSRFMRAQYGPAWQLLETIKHAIDPHGIMNPGKVGFGRGPGD
ncbi:FAD-binding oxidoreductase, partial [Acidobacteria bacterium AH-259-O06]|nr:FAD-binding oxidoreductase [Acidobacteria bacterium AH-259-O06]